MSDVVNLLLRDHVSHTGTGGAYPLPIGDPSSGVFNPSKKDLRDLFGTVHDDALAILETEVNTEVAAAAALASQAAAAASAAASAASANASQLAAIAAGAPIVTALPGAIPANGTINLLRVDEGLKVYQVVGGAWVLQGWLSAPMFGTVASLKASVATALGATGGLVLAGPYSYRIAAPAASDHHITTAGGVKLYINGNPKPLDAFGAAGDGATNDTAIIQAALAAGVQLFGAGNYAISTTLTIPAGVTISAAFKWIGAADGTMFTMSGQDSKLLDCVIDGNSLARTGVSDTGGLNTVEGCRITNLYSTTNQVVGIHGFSAAAGSIYCRNYFDSLQSVGDVTTGNTNGASRAILAQWNANFGAGYTIFNNDIRGVIGEEGDAIQILAINGTTFYSASGTRIYGNKIINPSKRGLKIQAHDVQCYENTIKLLTSFTNIYACITVQSASRVEVLNNWCETSVSGVFGIIASMDAGATTPVGVRIAANTVITAAGVAGVAIYSIWHDFILIDGNKCHNGRIIAETAVRPVVNSNAFHDTVISGSDGCVSFRNDCTAGAACGNIQHSGSNYTLVRADSQRTTIKDNVTLSVGYSNLSAVFVTVGNNIILGNVNAKTGVAAVNYGGGTSAGAQVLVANNATLGL